MKKILLVLAVMLGFAVGANAQDSKMAVGAQFNIGMGDSYTNYGIGARFQYAITDDWRAEAQGSFFFKKDYVSMYDVFANIHYLFHLNKKGVNVYPLFGIGFVGSTVSGFGHSTSTNKFGVNYGAGVEFPFAKKFKGIFEAKGQSSDGTRFILSFGAAYKF